MNFAPEHADYIDALTAQRNGALNALANAQAELAAARRMVGEISLELAKLRAEKEAETGQDDPPVVNEPPKERKRPNGSRSNSRSNPSATPAKSASPGK